MLLSGGECQHHAHCGHRATHFHMACGRPPLVLGV
jgi:hypothetical protein